MKVRKKERIERMKRIMVKWRKRDEDMMQNGKKKEGAKGRKKPTN
jgi:hypothetical protein